MLISYAIIRNDKYKMSNLSGISRHNERQNERYSNLDIDHEKTHLNYHIKKPTEKSYEREFYHIREVENLKGNLRITGKKQSNVACEFLITSDADFFKLLGAEATKRYFEDGFEFAKQRVGKQHVISAVVHMDESTPHLHVVYIPTGEGKDRQGNPCRRINCSMMWGGYNTYGQLQDEFHAFMTQKGYELERGDKNPDREHLTVAQLKNETLKKEGAEIQKEIKTLQAEKTGLKRSVKALKGSILSHEELRQLKVTPTITGGFKGITAQQFNDVLRTAAEAAASRSAAAITQENNAKLKERNDVLQKLATESRVELYSVNGKYKALERERNKLSKHADGLEQFIDKKGLTDEFQKERKQEKARKRKRDHDYEYDR